MLTIVSGGQTGVDRAALDAAIANSIDYGGWCPRGGRAEDMLRAPGVLVRYPKLHETPLADPAQRTEWNVRDSDRLLVLLDRRGLSSSGTEHAILSAGELGRPVLVLDLDEAGAPLRAAAWFNECAQGGLKLCIAGPRESEAPDIYAKARDFLGALLDRTERHGRF
jgi:hypothetical protein